MHIYKAMTLIVQSQSHPDTSELQFPLADLMPKRETQQVNLFMRWVKVNVLGAVPEQIPGIRWSRYFDRHSGQWRRSGCAGAAG